MKKNKKNTLLRISFFVSLAIHIVAIASINHLEIRSYLLSSSNVSFANKTDVPKKKTKDIMNIILKQKQIDLQKLIQKHPNITLPQSEINKNITNDFALANVAPQKNDFNFSSPSVIYQKAFQEISTAVAINENTNSHAEIQNIDNQVTYAEVQNENIQSSLGELATNIDNLLTNLKMELPGFDDQNQDLNLPVFDIQNQLVVSLDQKQNTVATQIDKKYNVAIANEIYTKAKELFKFSQIVDSDKNLVTDFTKFSKKECDILSDDISLVDMPNLEDLTTLPYKDYFDVEVTFSPQVNEKGYIFAITFVPKPTIKINRLKQNIFFLVDRSNSIQKDRLNFTRHAVTSTLPFLNEQDTFNILAFDTKLDVLSSINLKNDNINLSRARSFLRNQNIGSFFSTTNFSIPLYKILDKNVSDNEINIAILISNGDGLHKFKNSKVFNDWSQVNKGNLSLYTLCLEDDKNISILELFSSLNKGKLITSESSKSIKRKLQKLLKSISEPIAKDIVANSICLDTKANIKLFTSHSQAPNLYINEPYTILGTIDKLQDFTIFLQGKCKNNTFNLKKRISFDSAKQGGTFLQKELAMKKVTTCYEKYLSENKSLHLQEAKKHLKPFDMQPIFR